jgi:hypothetical protein
MLAASCDRTPAAPRATSAATPPPPRVETIGAEHTVAMQLQLIENGRLEDLRETFMPEVRERVTADAMHACRVRIHQVPVRPDWEMAEDGPGVRRVSMFGKSMTGFHEQPDGRWLADAVWCMPVGLP